MELSENLNRAASFTGKLFSDIGNLILLIVINLIPLVNFIFTGYMAKIIRESPEDPPKLSDYGKLFVDGLLIFIAALIYALIPALIMMVGGIGLTLPRESYGGVMSSLIFTPFLIIGLILLFAFMFMGVIAIGNMVRTGNFSKIFAFSENWGLIERIGFARYLIWLVIMFVILLIIGAIGSVIPWVGGAIAGVFFGVFFGKSLALILDELEFKQP
ncbi:MAG: DUF4013 domain-containing protein [Candidatus Korarchaeum sp.]